ncbi:MAG: TlpA family protein disulfide reductase [Dehalococcoidia bacterium]
MTTDIAALPAFTLDAADGVERSFPTGRHALICFVHEECETCGMSMPLIEQAHRAFGDSVDVWAVGQEAEGNAVLIERHGLTLPMLDDSELWTSFNYDLETVPAIYLASPDGAQVQHFVGFGRDDWRAIYDELATISGTPSADLPDVDWDSYPESRPGCGSRSVEPGIAERLAAEAEGSPLRARRIEIAPLDDPVEFMFDQGFTDGLPVVEPSPERVLRMLSGTKRDPQELITTVPPNMAPATVEKIAINAVMAGCKPEYLPVVIAALEAVCTDEFNIHGVMATTMGATPVIVVNGPIRDRIGMNGGLGVLGQGNRANASIGRALRLVLRNVGGARPGGTERSTQGSPAKFTLCFPEWEERSPWQPMHVERGFEASDSVVTVFALVGGPQVIVDQNSRSAQAMVGSIGLAMGAVGHPKSPAGDTVLVLCPEHLDTIWREGWSKEQVRDRIQAVTSRPVREMLRDDDSGAGLPRAMFGADGPSEEQLAQIVPKFRSTDNIHIVVAGSDAGKFSSVFAGWVSGPIGSVPVSRKIEEAR